MLQRDYYMGGAAQVTDTIPPLYRFVSVLNNTPYTIQLYRGSGDTTLGLRFGYVSAWSHSTLPLPYGTAAVTLAWAGSTETNKVTVIYSEVNLNINQTFAPAGGIHKVEITGVPDMNVIDRAGRQLGIVSLTGGAQLDVTDRPGRQLGIVSGTITNTPSQMAVTVTNKRFPAISGTGQAVIDLLPRRTLSVQNVGTVALLLWYNTTGLGDPVLILAAGTAADDGNGAIWVDESWGGAVYAKAGSGTGAALVMTY